MIHREDHGRVAVLRIEHGKANAVDIDLFDALDEQLEAVEESEARAVVLTGTGSAFSAGVDLFRVLEGGEAYLRAFLPALSRGIRRLFGFHRPVIAAVNGHAIAGGCILALACDRRVMARGKGKIGVTELKVGVPFPVAALEVLRFQMPDRLVQDLVYTGRLIGAEEARSAGLVDQLVDPEELMGEALSQAEALAAVPGDSFALTKRQLRQHVLHHIENEEEHMEEEIARIWSDPSTHRVIRAFVEATLGRG